MEPHQQQQQQQQTPNEDGGSSTGKGGNFLCRQSSTRWTPTTDQIRILKDLYYNSGVRSPTAEEIQRISARLRQYGKIEGKNVFYWFQNHKARERQKKRLNADVPMQRSNVSTPAWKSQDNNNNNNSFPKYSSNYNNPGMYASSSSSAGFITVGQMNDYGYGSVPMEKGFRECSLSAGGNIGNGGGSTISNNFGWVGIDPYASHYTLFDKINSNNEEDQEEEKAAEIETLPLFPMHNEGGINSFCSSKPADTTTDHGYYTSWYRSSTTTSDDVNGSSLELSLNSYSYMGHSRDYI